MTVGWIAAFVSLLAAFGLGLWAAFERKARIDLARRLEAAERAVRAGRMSDAEAFKELLKGSRKVRRSG